LEIRDAVDADEIVAEEWFRLRRNLLELPDDLLVVVDVVASVSVRFGRG
jgi:hypothetical protein